MAKQYKNMTETEYVAIKALLDAGVERKVASKVMNRSGFTIKMIANSSDYADYKTQVKAKWLTNPSYLRRQQEVTGAKQTQLKEVVESITEASGLELPASTPEAHMERIATALERLADAWENSPKKKGLFS